MRPATPARWIAVVWAAATALPCGASAQSIADFYRGKRINMYVSSTVGGGYDQYARLARQAHRPLHPGQSVDHGAEHARRRRHQGGELHLHRRAAGRHRDRRAVAQHRPRAALRGRQPRDPVRRPQDALDRLAAAGGRHRHLLDQEGPAHHRRSQDPRGHRLLHVAQRADLGLSAHAQRALRHSRSR